MANNDNRISIDQFYNNEDEYLNQRRSRGAGQSYSKEPKGIVKKNNQEETSIENIVNSLQSEDSAKITKQSALSMSVLEGEADTRKPVRASNLYSSVIIESNSELENPWEVQMDCGLEPLRISFKKIPKAQVYLHSKFHTLNQ